MILVAPFGGTVAPFLHFGNASKHVEAHCADQLHDSQSKNNAMNWIYINDQRVADTHHFRAGHLKKIHQSDFRQHHFQLSTTHRKEKRGFFNLAAFKKWKKSEVVLATFLKASAPSPEKPDFGGLILLGIFGVQDGNFPSQKKVPFRILCLAAYQGSWRDAPRDRDVCFSMPFGSLLRSLQRLKDPWHDPVGMCEKNMQRSFQHHVLIGGGR